MCASEPHELSREYAFTAASREDRARERWNQEYAQTEDADDDQRLQAVHQIKVLGDPQRQRRQIVEDEPLENHQKRKRDDGDERVLNERFEPRPEQPIELRDDEERD